MGKKKIVDDYTLSRTDPLSIADRIDATLASSDRYDASFASF